MKMFGLLEFDLCSYLCLIWIIGYGNGYFFNPSVGPSHRVFQKRF